jgi:plastocyanin
MFYRKGNAAAWVIIVIVIALLGWWFVAGQGGDSGEGATTTPEEIVADESEGSLEDDMIEEVVVLYTADGFEPSTITINEGQTVRWINQSGGDMWVASAMHPTHTVYPGSDIKKCGTGADIFDQCGNGASFEFTFNEVGEWAYHNHSRPADFGKIVVQ